MGKIEYQAIESDFCKRLRPVGRILEDPDYYVWCCAPIYDNDGKVHVFYSRWPNRYGLPGWLSVCEVAHAIADSPEGPYKTVGVALKGRGGDYWDSWSIHNPTIHKVGNKYVLFYLGTDGSDFGFSQDDIPNMAWKDYYPYYWKLAHSKRAGMAIADDLNGEWKRVGDEPLIKTGEEPAWDDFCTTNPAFVITPEEKYRVYYKAWDIRTAEKFNGNRKYGFVESDSLMGPYIKYPGNPVIDYSYLGEEIQCEDAYVWIEDGMYKLIMRDMGVFNHFYGLYLQSEDGIKWSFPQIAYKEAKAYFNEPLPGLQREGRFERPQILMKNGRPDYLFGSYVGGKYRTTSGVVLKIL